MANITEIVAVYKGQVMPYSFDKGFICLSYFISLVGSLSTLELMSRRTSHKGVYNQLLIVGAAISMGGISIWSMHFIGNRAVRMLDGETQLQIAYSVRTTVISLFLPILVLGLAFVISSTSQYSWWQFGLRGFLAGAAICGMHYLGNASIDNYHCEYRVATIVGAAIIAIAASTAALAVFFVLQAAWRVAWWRKILCAMLLAGGVSGMHWCAAVGTTYRLLHVQQDNVMSRSTTTIIVICLSIGAAVILVGSAIYSARTRRQYATKAQQIALAVVVFDQRGRILVNQEGLLPSEVITDRIPQKADNDVFGVRHPLFLWMFQASRNWPTIAGFVDAMGRHIDTTPGVTRADGLRLDAHETEQDTAFAETYLQLIREQFCLAAAALAGKTSDTLPTVGVLWDEICSTGAPSYAAKTKARNKNKDAEKGSWNDTRGALMFLVRHAASREEERRLEATAHRFVDIAQVLDVITTRMQIQTPDFADTLRRMASAPDGGDRTVYVPGVHLGLFALRARRDYTGFDVLVDRDQRGLLPTVPLRRPHLGAADRAVLARLDGVTLAAASNTLQALRLAAAEPDKLFVSELLDAVRALTARLADPVFGDAALYAKTIPLPSYSDAESSQPSSAPGDITPVAASSGTSSSASAATLISFRLMCNIHDTATHANVGFVPLQLLRAQQHVAPGSSRGIAFAHELHRDLSSVLAAVSTAAASPPTRSKPTMQWMRRLLLPFVSPSPSTTARPALFTTSQERLSVGSGPYSHNDQCSFDLDARSSSGHGDIAMKKVARTGAPLAFGGIMVSQQVTFTKETDDKNVESTVVTVAINGDGGVREKPTYVDDLMATFTEDK